MKTQDPLNTFGKFIGIGAIKLYRSLSFLRGFFSTQHGGPCCRFHPTCSTYTKHAIERFGLLKGMFLGAKRLVRCHPWNKEYGEDPVPYHFEFIKKAENKHAK